MRKEEALMISRGYKNICENVGSIMYRLRCCLGVGAKHSIMLIKLINEELVQAQYHEIRVPIGIARALLRRSIN